VTLACGPGHHGEEKAWDKAREAASIEGASENDQQQFYDRSEQREDASLRERPLAADCPLATFLCGFEINSLEMQARISSAKLLPPCSTCFACGSEQSFASFTTDKICFWRTWLFDSSLRCLKRRHPKPKLGAGRVPGTSVLAVVARRAISAQPPLPTNLIIFGLTGRRGGKKRWSRLSVNRPSRMGSSPSREATRTVFIGSPN